MTKQKLLTKMLEREKKNESKINDYYLDTYTSSINQCLEEIEFNPRFNLNCTEGADYCVQASVYVKNLLGEGTQGYYVIIDTDLNLPSEGNSQEELSVILRDLNEHAKEIYNYFNS